MKKIQLAGFMFLMVALISCGSSKKATVTQDKASAFEKELEHFPKAKPGYTRYVIQLPAKTESKEQSDLRVELVPGKVMPTDCNTRSLGGGIEEKELKGFGYTYYEFNSNGRVISTMMACPDNKKVDKFVAAKSELVRYNSKLPIVVYIPNGFELKYRLWESGLSFNAKQR